MHPRTRSIASIWASFITFASEPEEAQATWREIAEGKNRTAANLARLAEVLAGFGYLKEAAVEIAAACELDPKDFALQLKAADVFLRNEQYERRLNTWLPGIGWPRTTTRWKRCLRWS